MFLISLIKTFLLEKYIHYRPVYSIYIYIYIYIYVCMYIYIVCIYVCVMSYYKIYSVSCELKRQLIVSVNKLSIVSRSVTLL
jgi:hypothetical protein